jgi:predicted DCC family thiol-disulfide oxidoreductase YuxK
MGVVLIADLFGRMRYVKELYSNEGVLPNHNHLFNLRETGQVWSVLHAFSTPGEAQTALCFMLFFYACFLLGWHTRAFQVVALACLVSLGSRNILMENAGNYLAVALLAFTVFLPLGSRFSLDSLLHSMEARDEKGPRALNDRRRRPEAIQAARDPGWTPTSVAALAAIAQIAIVFACLGLQQKSDAWKDGSALDAALNVERWVSGLGASARHVLGPVVLAAWTRAFRLSELAIPALILLPIGFRFTRSAAAVLALFTGLTLGLFFSLGLFGWTLVAAAALLLSPEVWDRFEGSPVARRARTVIYDVDCGFCLWLARLLERLDLRNHLTFQGNDDLEGLNVRADATVTRRELPKEITADLVASSVVVVDSSGRVHTRARAVAEVIQALPLGWLIAWVMKLPGIVSLLGLAYDFVAARRQRISVAMGRGVCGIELPHEEAEVGDQGAPIVVAPAIRIARGVTGFGRDLAALVLFAAAVVQASQVNELLPWNKLPQPKWMASVVTWPRMLERWDVFVNLPTEDEVFVVDAQTRGGRSLDPFTGREPEFDPGKMRGTGLGQLWNDYLWRVHQREWADYQRAFRDYLNKGGPKWTPGEGDESLAGFDAYWIRQPIPAPGQPRPEGVTAREKFMSQARGGKFAADRMLPLLHPQPNKR